MREVLEETGFDISKLLKKEEYIEFTFRQQRLRLYIVAGVADDTAFAPQTKKEISVCCGILNRKLHGIGLIIFSQQAMR
ncbi:hypothetical protein Bca101_000618 [Brassica carinata]